MISIGDIVERFGSRSKHVVGRVTGFAPNGWPRVRVGEQNRIWPPEQLKRIDALLAAIQEAEIERQKDIRLEADMIAWCNSMADKERGRMIFAAFKKGMEKHNAKLASDRYMPARRNAGHSLVPTNSTSDCRSVATG